jgi:hypothetical protein
LIQEAGFIQYFNLYPNPAREQFTVELITNGHGPMQLRLMDAIGKLVVDREIKPINGYYKEEYSLVENATGVYYLQVLSDKGVFTRKLVLIQDY